MLPEPGTVKRLIAALHGQLGMREEKEAEEV